MLLFRLYIAYTIGNSEQEAMLSISNILARKTMKNRTRRQSMDERHKYDQKAEKTQDGDLISSFMCFPETAAEEFELSKRLYYQLTGRSQPKKRDIIMYRVIQSFKPGEVTPEQAHEIAYELAMKLTGGQHQFVVCTHTDRAHIHSHIEFNSTNLDSTGKFHVHQSGRILQRLNDEICRAYGLSVIEHPQRNSKAPGEAAAIKHGESWKNRLRETIDRVIPESESYTDFLARMRTEGYEIKEGKNLSFRAPGQERFTRSFRLGDNYTLDALRERCERRRGSVGTVKNNARRGDDRKINLLVDIQAKMAAGKGPGYEHWAKIFNLKEAAKTLNFLVDNDLTDYDELAAKAEQAGADFDDSSRRIKQLEARMAEIAQLKTHIINYSKTREVYAAYKKSRHKKEFLAEHADEIARHEAAKNAFDALDGKPIPKVAVLSEEYASLLAEKQKEYERYKAARQEMITLQNAKQNVDRILGLKQPEQEQDRDQLR